MLLRTSVTGNGDPHREVAPQSTHMVPPLAVGDDEVGVVEKEEGVIGRAFARPG